MSAESFFEEYGAITDRFKKRFLRRRASSASISDELLTLAARVSASPANVSQYSGLCQQSAAECLRREGRQAAATSARLMAANSFIEADQQMPCGRCSLNLNTSLQSAIALYQAVSQQQQQQQSPLAAGAGLQLAAVYQRQQLQQPAAQLLMEAARRAPDNTALSLLFQAVDITVAQGDLFRSEQFLKQIGGCLDSMLKFDGNASILHHRCRWCVTYLLLLLVVGVPEGEATDPQHRFLLSRFSSDADVSQLQNIMDENLFTCLQSLLMAVKQRRVKSLLLLSRSLSRHLSTCQNQLLIALIEQAERCQHPTRPSPFDQLF